MEFRIIAEYFERLEKTSSRLEMRDILHELFLKCPENDFSNLIYFCQGKIGPKYKGKEINIGSSTLIEIIAKYLGQNVSTIEKEFKEKGDLGLVVENFKNLKKQNTLFSKNKTFSEVYNTFEKMTDIEGKGAVDQKIKLFESIIYGQDVISVKYIVRFPVSLRLGFSDFTIIDALSLFDKENQKNARDIILEKYNLVSDLGLISKIVKEKGIIGIKDLTVQPFIPVKPALCERAKDLDDIFKRLGKDNSFIVDSKIDGFRMQIHKFKEKVKIFSRNEEDITNMFPDIVSEVLKIPLNFIIDSEAIGYDPINNKYHSFQITMQRKRKYDISEKSKELPLHLKVFDIIYFKEKEVYSLPFKERRKIIEDNFNISKIISPTNSIYVNSLEELEIFFKDIKNQGLEGIIAKDIYSKYSAGSRGFNWIKYKKSYDKENLDTVDVVVLGGYYGQGKRTITGLGALLVGIYDEKKDCYYSLAKVGSGLKDEILNDFSEMLKNITIFKKPENYILNLEPDFYVLPKIVIEVNFDDITVSSVHTTPLENTNKTIALRFPRFVKYRFDRTEIETTTINEISKIYNLQK